MSIFYLYLAMWTRYGHHFKTELHGTHNNTKETKLRWSSG